MEKFKTLFPALIAFVLLLPAVAKGQVTQDWVDEKVREAMDKFGVVGAAVAVVKDGEVVISTGYGVTSINTMRPVDEFTEFAIASNSKAFTTAALSILVDQGKVKWQDKVVDYIPEFRMYDPYVTANFTVEDLLTHRSGLGLGAGDLMFFPPGSDFTLQDVFSSFQHLKPATPFRTRYDYDNLLYFVAGEVIKRASGQPWDEFVQQKILAPLEMDHSHPTLKRITQHENVAIPHSMETGELRALPQYDGDQNFNGAAGGIFSCVNDLSKWMLLHLNQGKFGDNLGKQLYSGQRQTEMWTIKTPMNLNRDPRLAKYRTHFQGYGLGWSLQDVDGNLLARHTGGLPGMLSSTMLIPDQKLGIIVLTNTSEAGGFLMEAISRSILDRYLGMDEFDWTASIAVDAKRWRETGDQTAHKVWEQVEAARQTKVDPSAYLGEYVDPWFGTIRVVLEGDRLWFRADRSPKLNGPMQYYQANTFAIRWEYQDMNADAFAIFALDENGKAQSIKMKGISPNIDFSFDFQDLDLRRKPNQ